MSAQDGPHYGPMNLAIRATAENDGGDMWNVAESMLSKRVYSLILCLIQIIFEHSQNQDKTHDNIWEYVYFRCHYH